jgi:Carboxypeptidase regulatory-like domain
MMRPSCRLLACLLVALGVFAQQTSRPAPPPRAAQFRISGIVIDAATGAPLSQATVMVASVLGNREPLAAVHTTAGGRFQFDGLAAGKYQLVAQQRGYPPESLDEHEQFSSAVAVGPDLVSERIVFRLHRYASLSGQVLEESNEPVPNAQVMLFRKDVHGDARRAQAVQADDLGVYRFPHLPAGSYLVAAAARPWYAQHPNAYARVRSPGEKPEIVEPPPSPLDVAYPVTFYPNATDADSASTILLSSGEHATADVTLHAVPALHVRVRTPAAQDTPGRPQPPVSLMVRKKIFGAELPVPTVGFGGMPGGREITGLAPGRYELDITIFNGPHRTESRQVLDLAADTELDAAENAVPLVKVAGLLRIDGAAPAANLSSLTISLRDADLPGALGAHVSPVSPDGEFEFRQPFAPGNYEVGLHGRNMYLKSLRATGARLSGRQLQIGSEPVHLSLIAGQGVGTVTGTAYRNGKPQAGAMIVLVPENPTTDEVLFRRDQSDSDGTFTLAAAVPGKYVVIALGNWDTRWQDPQVLRRYTPHGQAVTVQAGGKYNVKVQVQ